MNFGIRTDVGVMPFLAGVTGVVIMFGTVIGQSGNTNSADDNSMSGMDMGPGSSSMSSMPGMSGGGSSGGSSGSSSSMPGMNMPGMTMKGSGPAAPSTGGTMKMPDGSTMASSAMPMNMSDPNMAASMPGGLHTSCSGSTCTVLFAGTATGTAKVLGSTAKLDKASAKQLVLTVGGKKLTLTPGKSVRAGKLQVELTKVDGKTYTVKFSQAR
ncbi:MAG TPA: hypothetical protein VHU88_05865 [Sporichthyaceae bacterium]|jgi:hypothetical protein|nr:hypothetical protein [Sporichthyaceae bacterium]